MLITWYINKKNVKGLKIQITNMVQLLCCFSSYLHCEWATAEKLMRADKRVQMKIKRYFIKRSTMPFPDEVLQLVTHLQ